MKCREVMEVLQKIAPLQYAEEWDNVGLIIGNLKSEIQSVTIALDPTEDVIEQAVCNESNLLITHHPLYLKGTQKVLTSDATGRRMMALISNNISYIAMHTNFDASVMGIEAARRLHLKKKSILDVIGKYHGKGYGCGIVGNFEHSMTGEECVNLVKEAFHLDEVRVYGNTSKILERCAILPGSGADEIGIAKAAEADVYITGDIKHHAGLDASMDEMLLIDAGHYGLEKMFTKLMSLIIQEHFPCVKVIWAEEKCPYTIY